MAQKRKNDGITGQTPAEAIQADLLADGYPVTITRAQAKLIDAAAAIMLDPEPTDADRAFLARQLVQVTLPHSNPGDVPIWRRRNGRLTLTLRPYTDNDGKPLYPYGSIPRLLLYWITTEAVRTGSRRLELGDSVSAFMRELGLNPNNGGKGAERSDARRLRDQMLRLCRSTISFDVTEGDKSAGGKGWRDMQIAPAGELWWDFRQPDQQALFGSWIELGEQFFHAITTAPVPLNMVALKALKRSPMALDLYAWATYRTFTVTHAGKPAFIPWRALALQMGADYADPKNAKKAMQAALVKVRAVFPALNIKDAEGGFWLLPSRPAVSPRSV